MRFFRIGDKIVSREKLVGQITGMLRDREQGATQAQTATAHGVERSFVSWLETLGEIRRGRRVALVAFPVSNGPAVTELAQRHGVEFVLTMSQQQRQDMSGEPGDAVFNRVLQTLATLKDYDTVVLAASDLRIDTIERILGREVVSIRIGSSPMTQDVVVDLDDLAAMLEGVTSREPHAAATGVSKLKPAARTRAGDLLRSPGRWPKSKKS